MRTNFENKSNFLVFKKDKENYRVKNLSTGEIFESGKFLVLNNARPFVNFAKYQNAKDKNFVNSGKETDFFAGLICESFEQKREPNVFQRIKESIFFNPFKSKWFLDRSSGKPFRPYQKFKFIIIEGNTLKYIL